MITILCLDNTDVIEGGASVDAVVDYTMHGLVGTTFTQLAAGVLSDTLTAVLYTAGAAVSVVNITLVNTHSAAVDVTLCLDPGDAGNPRYIIPETISLGIGYSLHTDGTRITVMDASGNIQTLPGLHAALHKAGGADELLNDPGAIGGDTPAAGAFTTISASGLITATGGQIAFPATAVPSADANTLDDYEEGSHTATIVCATSGNYTLSAAGDLLSYTKIGRMVHLQGVLIVTGENAPNGTLRISIPFASFEGSEEQKRALHMITIANHGDAGLENPYIITGSNLTYLELKNVTDTGTLEDIDDARVDTAFNIYMSIFYTAT